MNIKALFFIFGYHYLVLIYRLKLLRYFLFVVYYCNYYLLLCSLIQMLLCFILSGMYTRACEFIKKYEYCGEFNAVSFIHEG